MQVNNVYPVDRLLTLGDPRQFQQWPNYLGYGLTEEHIPKLIRIATDMDLHNADGKSAEVWAPLHAWRALGQLRAGQAIEPLLSILDLDDDWIGEELPVVFGMIGTKAIPALAKYLADESHEVSPRARAAHGLEKIASNHPEARNQCLEILMNQLERSSENDPTLNGLIISSLIHINGREALPVIRKVLEANAVDLTIAGDLEDVEILMGLRQERSTPKPDYHPEHSELRAALKRYVEHIRAEEPKPQKRKIGRNDPCTCGSGKKYKKCCLNKGNASKG